jgi:hypothetical protein
MGQLRVGLSYFEGQHLVENRLFPGKNGFFAVRCTDLGQNDRVQKFSAKKYAGPVSPMAVFQIFGIRRPCLGLHYQERTAKDDNK